MSERGAAPGLDILDDGLLDLGGGPTVAEGVCHLCRSRSGRMTCRACQRPTCASDLWTMFALCRACVPADQMQRWHVRGDVDAENWLTGAEVRATGASGGRFADDTPPATDGSTHGERSETPS